MFYEDFKGFHELQGLLIAGGRRLCIRASALVSSLGDVESKVQAFGISELTDATDLPGLHRHSGVMC